MSIPVQMVNGTIRLSGGHYAVRTQALVADAVLATILLAVGAGPTPLGDFLGPELQTFLYYLRWPLFAVLVLVEFAPTFGFDRMAAVFHYAANKSTGDVISRIPRPLRSRTGGLFITECVAFLIGLGLVLWFISVANWEPSYSP